MADESKHQELQEKERQERQKILAEAENLTRELVLTEKTYLDVRGNLSEKLTNSLEWKKADKNVKNIIEILVQAHQKISRSQDKLIAVFFFPDRENAFGLREVEIFFNIIQENIREMLIGAFEYEKFREILLKLTEGKDYLTYKDASGKSQQYRIFDDLITIVQRGPRYILLLDSLIKILERLKNKYPGEENNIELEKIKELQASIKNELDALNLAIEIINIPVFTEKKMAEKESHMQKMLPEVISKAIMLALLCEFRLNYSSLYTIFSDEKAYFEDFQKNIGRCENIQTLVAFLHKVIAETPSENLAEVAQVLLHKRQALEIQCMLLASPLENRRTELLNLIKKFPGYAEAINCFATLLKSRDFEAFKQAKKQYLETLPPEIAEIINICDARFTQEEAENILAKKAMQKIYALEEANAEMIQANAALERARKKLEEVKRAEEKNHTEELEQFSREIITAANKSPEFAMELGFFATCVKTRNLEGYRKARDEYLLTLSEAAPELAQMVTKGCGLLKPLQTKVAVLKEAEMAVQMAEQRARIAKIRAERAEEVAAGVTGETGNSANVLNAEAAKAAAEAEKVAQFELASQTVASSSLNPVERERSELQEKMLAASLEQPAFRFFIRCLSSRDLTKYQQHMLGFPNLAENYSQLISAGQEWLIRNPIEAAEEAKRVEPTAVDRIKLPGLGTKVLFGYSQHFPAATPKATRLSSESSEEGSSAPIPPPPQNEQGIFPA